MEKDKPEGNTESWTCSEYRSVVDAARAYLALATDPGVRIVPTKITNQQYMEYKKFEAPNCPESLFQILVEGRYNTLIQTAPNYFGDK